jgi:hypothetical protein
LKKSLNATNNHNSEENRVLFLQNILENLYKIKAEFFRKNFKKSVDKRFFECYIQVNKCDEQKPVGRKESGESCRVVRGKEEVLLEFILLAVR